MITKEKYAYRKLFFRDHGRELRRLAVWRRFLLLSGWRQAGCPGRPDAGGVVDVAGWARETSRLRVGGARGREEQSRRAARRRAGVRAAHQGHAQGDAARRARRAGTGSGLVPPARRRRDGAAVAAGGRRARGGDRGELPAVQRVGARQAHRPRRARRADRRGALPVPGRGRRRALQRAADAPGARADDAAGRGHGRVRPAGRDRRARPRGHHRPGRRARRRRPGPRLPRRRGHLRVRESAAACRWCGGPPGPRARGGRRRAGTRRRS